jgi:hypothetical protein
LKMDVTMAARDVTPSCLCGRLCGCVTRVCDELVVLGGHARHLLPAVYFPRRSESWSDLSSRSAGQTIA